MTANMFEVIMDVPKRSDTCASLSTQSSSALSSSGSDSGEDSATSRLWNARQTQLLHVKNTFLEFPEDFLDASNDIDTDGRTSTAGARARARSAPGRLMNARKPGDEENSTALRSPCAAADTAWPWPASPMAEASLGVPSDWTSYARAPVVPPPPPSAPAPLLLPPETTQPWLPPPPPPQEHTMAPPAYSLAATVPWYGAEGIDQTLTPASCGTGYMEQFAHAGSPGMGYVAPPAATAMLHTPPPPRPLLRLSDVLSVPELGSSELPTRGSLGHRVGTCKPCAFAWKETGCANGVECPFCHLCGPGERRLRKKERKSMWQNTHLLPQRRF